MKNSDCILVVAGLIAWETVWKSHTNENGYITLYIMIETISSPSQYIFLLQFLPS